jgi:hypothetical protein
MNRLITGNIFSEEVDALANFIVNDTSYLLMHMTSALNESQAKQTRVVHGK